MNDYYTGNSAGNGSAALHDADAMIRANGQAEAQEMSDLKATVRQYQAQVDQLRDLQKNSAQLLEAQRQRNDQLQKSNAQTLARIQALLEDLSEKAQAPDWSGLEKHVDDAGYTAARKAGESVDAAREELSSQLQELQEKIADLIQQSDDFQHKENVRVYRNVQAATDQLLQKQTDDLKADLQPAQNQDRKGHTSGISIAAFVVSLLTLVYVVCDSLGVVQQVLGLLH